MSIASFEDVFGTVKAMHHLVHEDLALGVSPVDVLVIDHVERPTPD